MKSYKTFLVLSFMAVGLLFYFYKNSNSQIKDAKESSSVQESISKRPQTSRDMPSEKKGASQQQEQKVDLTSALESENHQIILDQIDSGTLDINDQNESGMTLLGQALDYDQIPFAYALIKRGAKLDTQVLTQALLLGETKMVKMALQAGANPNTELDLIGSALLMYAAQEGQNESIEQLIDYGVRVNHQNDNGETALMWAADMGQEKTVEVLLKLSADKTLKNKNGQSAYDFAQKRGLDELAQRLKLPR